MTELSESEGSGPRRTGAGGDDSGPEAPDRPKLVAVPGPEARAQAAGAPADAVAPPAIEDPESASDEPDPHARRLELERSLRAPRGPADGFASSGSTAARPLAGDAPAAPASPAVLGTEPSPGAPATAELARALRTELAMRATAEAGLRARVVDAESRLAARVVLSRRTAETLRAVRAELEQLAALTAAERTRRVAAERRVAQLERELAEIRGRSGDADREIASLRDSLVQLRTPPDDAGSDPPGDAGTVVPDRLTDALSRLRANAEPAEGQPVPGEGSAAPGEGSTAPAAVATPSPLGSPVAPARLPTPVAPTPAPVASLPATIPGVTTVAAPAISATLESPFRTLTRRDPALAGRLAISLLGMERVAYPHPISFDLLLGQGGGCLRVTSSEARTDVVAETTARPLEQVGFRVVGGPDRLARLLVAGRLRRRLGFGVARVRGDRDGLAALDALRALPLDLPALVDGGMLADSRSLLSLVAAMVRPEWTRGAHFALSHRDGDASPTYLRFAGGRRPEVTTTAPAGPIATVISCDEHDLASVLTGAMATGTGSAQVLGDPAPLHQLQSWIKRAQSG